MSKDDLVQVTTDEVTKDYTETLMTQCDKFSGQLSGISPNFLKLITIQALYDTFKYYVSKVEDSETQERIMKVIEFDSKNFVYPVKPTVDYVGNA